jgi:chromosome segregation ATPase
LNDELVGWRDRASRAEGELLRLRAQVAELGETAALLRTEELSQQAEATQRRADAALYKAEEEWRNAQAARQRIEERALSFARAPSATELAALGRQVGQLERRMGEASAVIGELEGGVAALRAEAASAAKQRAPSVWATQREEALRSMAGELGMRDAELMLLNAGVTSLRQRLAEAARTVGEVRSRLGEYTQEEVRGALDRLGERLSGLVS